MVFTDLTPSQCKPKQPITLCIGELEDYDFSRCCKQIYDVLITLNDANILSSMPYASELEVLEVVLELIDDIDIDVSDWQSTEKSHIRVEFRDELITVEVFLGV